MILDRDLDRTRGPLSERSTTGSSPEYSIQLQCSTPSEMVVTEPIKPSPSASTFSLPRL